MPKRIFILILSTFFLLPALAAEKLVVTGDIFAMDGKEKKFLYERYQDVDGTKSIDRALYKSLSGEILVEEKMESLNGELIRYDLDHKQLKKKAWIELTNKTVTFNLKKEGKGSFPQTIKKKENFVVGLQLVPYIKKHWAALEAGKELEIRLGVWDRQEAIRFDLEKDEGKTGQFVIKMKPSSMFIRAVVNPIYFIFDEKNKRLIEYKGRTAAKEKKDGEFKDYDGITRYKPVTSKK